ncbi:B3 domain-containing protein [Cardamine amara subsp. amara]|uniref:B3 domain-containing protein n=1 Tax=Cardamine amara subsp. amara TaxID=228776 RepID=A0ABD1AB34_CARAN
MDKYYEAQLAAKGKNDEWSNFLCLVDASVMVKKVEDDIIEIEKKKKKKTTSPLAKRSYSQQNHESLDGASTSSSLLDLNQVPTDSSTRDAYRRFISSSDAKTPQNPDEEERRAKKGKSKIVSEDLSKKKTLFDHVPRKIRSTLRQTEFENLNGASTSSSSQETKTPPNPIYKSSPSSCLTESTSSKKLAVQQSSSGGKSKRAKFVFLPRRMHREMPEWILEVIRDMDGVGEPRLIFETELSASDVNQGQSRLLIPFNKLLRNDFLTLAECIALAKVAPIGNRKEEDNFGVGTILVNQRSQKFGLRIKRYEMKKESGLGTSNYALNYDWNYVVKKNHLEKGSKISLWTFRCREILCFALETR